MCSYIPEDDILHSLGVFTRSKTEVEDVCRMADKISISQGDNCHGGHGESDGGAIYISIEILYQR
jgi:hypothetical protein